MMVELPDSLVKRLELLIADSGMSLSVEDFVLMVVRDAASRVELRDASPFTPGEEEKIKERLKDLGYID